MMGKKRPFAVYAKSKGEWTKIKSYGTKETAKDMANAVRRIIKHQTGKKISTKIVKEIRPRRRSKQRTGLLGFSR